MGARHRVRNWLIVIVLAAAFPVALYVAFWAVIGFWLSRGGY